MPRHVKSISLFLPPISLFLFPCFPIDFSFLFLYWHLALKEQNPSKTSQPNILPAPFPPFSRVRSARARARFYFHGRGKARPTTDTSVSIGISVTRKVSRTRNGIAAGGSPFPRPREGCRSGDEDGEGGKVPWPWSPSLATANVANPLQPRTAALFAD